jgi:hypothetical protein
MKMAVFWVVATCTLREVNHRFRDPHCLDGGIASIIALKMEAVSTSGTVVHSYRSTRRYNPEDGHLDSHRRENLKSYVVYDVTNKTLPG